MALPSEIMRLQNLRGYLKFPGPWPVARIGLDYVHRPKAAERFVPREEGQGTAGPQPEPAVESRQGELEPGDPRGSGQGTREEVEATESVQASATPHEGSARQNRKPSEKDDTGEADPALSLPEKGGNSTKPQRKPHQGRLRRI